MIGRDRELRQLTQLVASRRPAVAILARRAGHRQDPPGAGAAADRCPSRRVVLVGQAEPGSLARPYELLLDAIDGPTAARSTRTQLAALDRPAPQPGRAAAHRPGASSPTWSATRPP